ncbi:MAG: hypothetical protein A49_06840 [Methyloceanibacter sp.]|nr:MAG: hypothetical protein A49_06840 [Methyloceanibacter sp.]
MAGAPIKVGILFSQTGVTSATERGMSDATLFAIEQVNAAGGINGREIVPFLLDPGSHPDAYYDLANKLLIEFGVKIIFGCYMSSSRKAALRAVERQNGLLCYPAQYEGFEYSRNAIYCGAVANQISYPLGEYLLESSRNRFYMVGSDYIWPRESDRIMTEMVLRDGGEIVGRQYLKLSAKNYEFVELVKNIKAKQPDVIFCNFVGDSIIKFYQAYADAGLSARTMPIASLTTSEADIAVMGHDVGAGHITSATYFQTHLSAENRTCLQKYEKWKGQPVITNMCWEAAYFQVGLVADALREVETDEPDVLRKAILGREFLAPQGKVRIDPSNGHANLWPKIGRARDDGQFEIVAIMDRVVPDPYLVSSFHRHLHSEMNALPL